MQNYAHTEWLTAMNASALPASVPRESGCGFAEFLAPGALEGCDPGVAISALPGSRMRLLMGFSPSRAVK